MTKKSKEQIKQERIDRLAKAREARMATAGPPQSIHPNVYAKPDDYYLSVKNVKQWIKSNKENVGPLKRAVRLNTKGAKAELAMVQGYIRNMETYLRGGDWVDDFYGENQEKKIKWRTVVPAYDEDGCVK
jgi:hypothetical protein